MASMVLALSVAAVTSFVPIRAPSLHAVSPLASAGRHNAKGRVAVHMLVTPETAEVAKQTFEPEFNPAQLGVVFFAIAVPFGYWWFITVPEARLALSKVHVHILNTHEPLIVRASTPVPALCSCAICVHEAIASTAGVKRSGTPGVCP